jgi:hypothetical protein
VAQGNKIIKKGASWQFHKFKIGSKTQQEMEHFTIKDGSRLLIKAELHEQNPP